jgi:hypothetical protein
LTWKGRGSIRLRPHRKINNLAAKPHSWKTSGRINAGVQPEPVNRVDDGEYRETVIARSLSALYIGAEGKAFMTEEQNDEERPCLHCIMVDLIDDYFAEYPATAGGSDKVDTGEADEVIVAIAKTVAELTSRQDGTVRQQLIEALMREILHYDAEFRLENGTGAIGSGARH